MIVILAPQYSGGAKDSMGRFVNAVFNDLETSQFLVFDRIWMARKYSSAKYLRILPWFFAYWIFAYFELRKKNVKLIISISQEYVLPFSLKDQIVIVHDLIQLFFPRNLQAWIFYSKYLKFVLPRVREILTPSSTTLRYLSRFNYSKKGKVIGVPLDIGRRFSMDVDVVRDIDLLWIGTVASHKRLRYFLDSIKSCDFPINALIIVPPSNCADVENIIGNYVFPGSVGLLSGIGDAELAGIYKRSK